MMRELLPEESGNRTVKTHTFIVSVESIELGPERIATYIQSMLEDEGYGPFDSVKVRVDVSRGERV